MSENSFNLDRLRLELKPFRLRWFARLGSTNDHAALLRKRGQMFAPAVVLTGHQTSGRGRNGNSWWSSEGSLTVTFVLPIDEHRAPHQLPLIAGLAVRNAVAQLTGNQAIQLKWPNDLLHEGRKLAGLLCERVHNADLVGVGMNINAAGRAPNAIRARLISLSQIAGRAFDKTDVLVAIAKELHPVITHRHEHPFPAILREYDRHHALVGRTLTITGTGGPSVRGVCQGLDAMGRLLIRSGSGQTHRIIAGQVDMDHD